MSTSFYLDIYDLNGDRKYVITDFTRLSYLRKVNAPGLLQFGLRGDHPALADLDDKWQVEVWRKPDGGSYYRDFVGLVRRAESTYQDKSSATIVCPGLLSLLSWRIVAWQAGIADRSKFTAESGETIMKILVGFNAGPDATILNGRLREGAIPGLSVEIDGGRGEVLDWFCAYENLLVSLQKLAPLAEGDFDLVKTTATSWQFRWFTGQLGTDRSASVIFSLERGNMAGPSFNQVWIDEKTVAIVGGKGEEDSREIAVQTSSSYSSGNDIEMFVNGSSADTENGLETQGLFALRENRAQNEFNFQVLQTPATRYGVHYFLGDIVTAVNPFTGNSLTVKLDQAEITFDESGAEKVDIKMVEP